MHSLTGLGDGSHVALLALGTLLVVRGASAGLLEGLAAALALGNEHADRLALERHLLLLVGEHILLGRGRVQT